ncbi:MAG: hypothetical protein HOK67_13985 [Deltaproteobacteria bacterium]|jgi:secernin|nr:hypothetical protein [Deltaproteobacteria bacterium]MBT6501004.1 hypothetical protein [Deltaproteobacteria bacterium]MBT7154800.1 hypothetical protein [Deltaproteobacteria bacterium]MBT7711738.1 hypothetical protein [Deltaproteobacteria bacterium]
MCDTFVALPSVTSDRSVIFGKNSDREPNEAQALEYYPSRRYSNRAQEKTACTYITVPQVKETNAVLLSRPFWMWGAEIGANEKGVVIGNEAVFTKMPYSNSGGLTGMDMIRLALERSATSQQALETIVQLLADHGQGGICGYQDKKLVYHNSFIIADTDSAWVLETAGHLWAALEVKDAYSISNGLTIGEKFDRSHPQLVSTAQSKGWLKKGKPFHFARCYSDWFFTTFSACRKRRSRSFDMLNTSSGEFDVQRAFNILRDHGGDDYRPDSHFLISAVCMHAANGLSRNGNSTGSLVAHLKKEENTFWATGTSAPCTGIFKPIRFGDDVLPDLGPPPGEKYDSTSLWWQHEVLHRNILNDYPSRLNGFKEERDRMEASFLEKASIQEPKYFFELSREAFQSSREMTDRWVKQYQDDPIENSPGFVYQQYWKKQNRAAGMMI